jgi:hypothetical protein
MKVPEEKRVAVVLGMMRGIAKNDPETAKMLAKLEAESQNGVIDATSVVGKKEFTYLIEMFEAGLEAYHGA